MVDQVSLNALETRIQIVEDNLHQLMEQAAAYSGAADEERNADRIAEQQAKLDALLKERDELRMARAQIHLCLIWRSIRAAKCPGHFGGAFARST